ncbi:MAG: crosslink repair DNA glycosylase YcaQ family protein [Dokdonella sp.]|uniref:winged helix-turn-helix domain-containing protein n=1 Tax=Dokdonella sp. TaxID=2291710 RepID=UPI003263ADAA
MPLSSVSAHQARLIHLGAQGVLARPARRARKADVLAAIERMRVLQIDTINVVARSPYLVLFARLGSYDTRWLEEWLSEGAIFECWAHEACFAPFADFELHRRHFGASRAAHWSMKSAHRTRNAHAVGMAGLLSHIRERGPVKASEFERADGLTGGGWWGWKDEKRWLEALFATGELMITRRENFQRVYDLSERVVAKAVAFGTPIGIADEREMQRAFHLGAVRALGIAQARWVNDYFRAGGKLKDAALDPFVESGELLRVEVDGWSNPGYVHRDNQTLLQLASANRLRATHTTLLSPFDPVVWDRERASTMFGFDYRIECYTPAPKRMYGYFVLPILHRGRLVGRLDAKAHRADGMFEVKALFLEDGVEPSDALAVAIAPAIRQCAEWHATREITVRRCEPKSFGPMLRAALRGNRNG